MAQCKIKWDPLRRKLIIQEPFEREGEFFLELGPESAFLFSSSPSFCTHPSLCRPSLGSRPSRLSRAACGQWGCVKTKAWRACTDLSTHRLTACPLLGAGLVLPQLQAGVHLGENGRKLDSPVVGGDGGLSSPGLPRKAGGPLLCLWSGRLGSEYTLVQRQCVPIPGVQAAGSRDKGLLPPTHPPTWPGGTAQCPGALGLCPCFVFHLHHPLSPDQVDSGRGGISSQHFCILQPN